MIPRTISRSEWDEQWVRSLTEDQIKEVVWYGDAKTIALFDKVLGVDKVAQVEMELWNKVKEKIGPKKWEAIEETAAILNDPEIVDAIRKSETDVLIPFDEVKKELGL
jgi:hypothetical protein